MIVARMVRLWRSLFDEIHQKWDVLFASLAFEVTESKLNFMFFGTS
jgi:hypothetical protein